MRPGPRRARILLAGCALACAALSPAREQAGAAPGAVPWARVAGEPCRVQGREIRVRVQMRGALASWLAGPTRFGPGDFAGFEAWADEQLPWNRADFDAPAARVFTRRGGATERALAAALPHERFELRAVVREVWRDRPWVEVLAADPLAEAIGEASVIHASRALRLMSEGSWTLAEEELRQALAAPLPIHAQAELQRLLAECAERSSDTAEAPGTATPR